MARLVFCAILLVCLQQTAAKDFWAIDCGGKGNFSSTSYLRNVTWEPDDAYVRGGEARNARTNPSDSVLQTMRVFDSEKPAKSCYTIPVGSGRKVIARAWFYYGNYDGKSEPPQFELQFDANEWTSIETEMDDWEFEELVYVTKKANTSICVAKGGTGQSPLVSGIQVAVLNMTTYGSVNSSRALFWSSRVAFGASKGIRDKYGRYWGNTTQSLNLSDYTLLTNTEGRTPLEDIGNDPPEEVFRTAITPKTRGGNITIRTPYLLSTPRPIYFALYFTDPTPPPPPASRGGNDSLSFHIYLDGSVISNESVPVEPTYGVASEYTSSIGMGSENTFLDLMSTPGASRPPVVSAWELYRISGELANGTDSSDVNGLSTLQNRFEVLQQWTGDPCLPKNYNWEWVACDSNSPPRITNILLSGFGLSGTLPDFSSLEALVSIDLSNNSLTGDIPSFLGQMPNLRNLNLADNDFAAIPPSLQNNKKIMLNVSGNRQLRSADGPSAAATLPQSAGTQRLSAYSKNLRVVLGMFATYIMCAVGAI